jgi:AcrR family transcriptional regulator
MADKPRPRRREGATDEPRTRGGWVPVGTAAARRARQDQHGTDRGRTARAHLLKAARCVFERQGYFDATVDDIVAEAGIARGSFYTYFPSKKDVFRALLAEIAVEVQQAIRRPRNESHESSVFQTLDESNRRYLAAYRANSAMLALIEQVSTVDPEIHELRLKSRQSHVRRVERSIRRWQEMGVADPSIDLKSTAGALVSMLSNFGYWLFAGGDTYDEERSTRTLTDIWARAIDLQRPPKPPSSS